MISERLKSRKFWMTLVGLGTIVATELLGVGAEVAHTIAKAIEILIPVYVGSQGVVDSSVNLLKYFTKKS